MQAKKAFPPPSLAAVATSGAYGDLTGLPTLGAAVAKNVVTAANYRANSGIDALITDQVWSAAGVVTLTDGGTGATSASAARTNLGATSVGVALFTAADAAAARVAIGAPSTAEAVDSSLLYALVMS